MCDFSLIQLNGENKIIFVTVVNNRYQSGNPSKKCPLANSKTKNNRIIVRWRSSLKDQMRS